MSNEKKIILFALPDFSGGGAERVFLNLINNISLDSFEVHVAVGKFQGKYCDELINDITLHELGSIKSLSSIFSMVRLLRRLKPHIIFSTLGYIVTASIASIFSKNKIIIISRFGNTMSSFLNEQKDQSLVKYFLQFAVNKLVIYLSDLIIVQSNHMKDDLNRIFSLNDKLLKKIIKINNPIEFSAINSIKNNSNYDNFFKKNFVFISVGRLDYRKNYEDLLRAFSIVFKEFPNARLMILGEGEYRMHLEKTINELFINNYVLLPGFVHNPESLVSKSNFYVSSSLYEGVSNSILEALSLGIPVIATDCPSGVGEIVKDGVNGYLVSMNDSIINNLAHRMSSVIKDTDKDAFSDISNKIEKEFDVNTISNLYKNLFLELLELSNE
jgi:glycosyltransferase involved in cell wall biosynthesis